MKCGRRPVAAAQSTWSTWLGAPWILSRPGKISTGGGLTVSVTVDVAESLPAVPVIVCCCVAVTTVGVPDITPLEEFSESPAGSDGETEYVGVDENPVAVSAGVGVIAVSTTVDTMREAGVSVGPTGALGLLPQTIVRVRPFRVSATECVEFDIVYLSKFPWVVGPPAPTLFVTLLHDARSYTST
jgi:hypothetical protein